MQIVEFSMPVDAWKGLNTRYPADTKFVGPDDFTDGSFNFLTSEHGVITKRTGTDLYNLSELEGTPKDQYEAIFDNGVRHLLITETDALQYSTGDREFHEVEDGFTANSNWEFATFKNRVYMGNGVDDPQVYDNNPTYGGVTTTVPNVKDMGAQAPGSALTVGVPTGGGSVPAGAHTYKYTFVYYDFEESNGSSATGVTTIVANHTVPLTIAVGGQGCTARKIYRDDNDGNWLLVKTVADNTATTTTDTAAIGTTPIPDDNNEPPTFSLVVNYRDRLWVAGVSDAVNTLYYSDAGLPDVFLTDNRVACSPKDPITGLLVFNDKVLVFNRNSMGQILGTTSNDFRYSEISNSVGCVDCRSIRIRTINGVPVVIFLSERDFYAYNGSQLAVISDTISTDLQLNIQQAVNAKSKNIQSTQADFQAGTASSGIELTLIPGTITTKGYSGTTNPTKNWDTEAEWTGGSSLANIAQLDNSNAMTVPLTHAPAYSAGTLSSAVISGTDLKLPVTTDFTGENFGANGQVLPLPSGGAGMDPNFGIVGNVSQSFTPTRTGTMTQLRMPGVRIIYRNGFGTPSIRIRVRADSSGTPGTILYNALVNVSTVGAVAVFAASNFLTTSQTFTVNPALALTGGSTYWIGYEFVQEGANDSRVGIAAVTKGTASRHVKIAGHFTPTSWVACTNMTSLGASYDFTTTPVASAGTWVGPIYDAQSDSTDPTALAHTATYPTGTSAITFVDATDDENFITGITTVSTANLNGTFTVATSDLRYWRIRINLASTDDRITPTIQPATLSFEIVSTWISEVIDHTTNITTLDALTMASVTPVGTTAVVTIATSTDNITYSSYVAVGSAVPHRYSKVKVVLTGTGTATPTVTSVRLDWSLTANLISDAIDTVVLPAGWGIFQADFEVNGGTVVFEVRTAASEVGLGVATFETVTNGVLIPNDVLRWVQWRVTISSSADAVPEITSVIVNWLNTLAQGIRVASIFYNKNYYMAVADYSSPTNNLVFVYDQNGTWKKFHGLSIATMGLFFSEPYYGDALEGAVVKWLDPGVILDQGVDVELQVRTKAFGVELADETKTKMLRSLVLKVMGTGARITPSYSVDGGLNFLPLADISTGSAYYDAPADNKLHFVRFSPASAQTQWNYTLMMQLYNNDEFPVEVHGMRARVFISERPVR